MRTSFPYLFTVLISPNKAFTFVYNNRRARCTCTTDHRSALAMPVHEGHRHPGYTRVPPGCPRGCNEDKSLAYLINSRRSPVQRVPSPSLLLLLLFLSLASFVLRHRESNRERVFAGDADARKKPVTYSLQILVLMRSRHERHRHLEALRRISTRISPRPRIRIKDSS